MDLRQARMMGHGAIVTFIGLLAGFGLVMKLIGGFELVPGLILEFELPATDRAWARAHAGGLMNGLLVFCGGLIMWGLEVPERLARHAFRRASILRQD